MGSKMGAADPNYPKIQGLSRLSRLSYGIAEQNLWVPRRRDSPRILTSNKLYPILMGIKVVATSQLPIQTSDLRGQRCAGAAPGGAQPMKQVVSAVLGSRGSGTRRPAFPEQIRNFTHRFC